jgi:hypothetical protein
MSDGQKERTTTCAVFASVSAPADLSQDAAWHLREVVGSCNATRIDVDAITPHVAEIERRLAEAAVQLDAACAAEPAVEEELRAMAGAAEHLSSDYVLDAEAAQKTAALVADFVHTEAPGLATMAPASLHQATLERGMAEIAAERAKWDAIIARVRAA